MYQPLSLSFFLSLSLSLFTFAKTVWIQIRPERNSGKLKICACYRKYAKCTKADAHDKMGFQYISISVDIVRSHARIQRGDRGSGPPPPPPPLENHKNIEFLSNTGPDPLKLSKLPNPPAKCHSKADDGLLLVIFGSSLP